MYVASGRRPSSHTVKRILATGPKPTSISRRYPRYPQMEPADRRLAIIRLHAEGWTVTSIAAYLETNRPHVYDTLRRWVEEGVQGLEDKPHIPRHPRRKVDLRAISVVRTLQENPELGEFLGGQRYGLLERGTCPYCGAVDSFVGAPDWPDGQSCAQCFNASWRVPPQDSAPW